MMANEEQRMHAQMVLQEMFSQQLLALLTDRLPDQRTLFALVAMHGALANWKSDFKPSDLARDAVTAADYVVAELAKVHR